MESGRVWKARDIGIPSRPCKWMSNGFMAINTKTGAGKAFLRSIYELYASWGVDFGIHTTNIYSSYHVLSQNM